MKKSGFTLVELIVVIAVMAILAGVAIPVYTGYINKARQGADLYNLDVVKTAAVFAYTQNQASTNQPIETVESIVVTPSSCVVFAGDDAEGVELTEDPGFISHVGQTGDRFAFGFTSHANEATWTLLDNKWEFSGEGSGD